MFSLEKERRLGEWHNLVTVVEHTRGLTEAQALAVACEMISVRTREYLAREERLLVACPTDTVRRYAEGMRTWIRGNLDWSRDTHRYREREHLAPSGARTARYLEPSLMGAEDPEARS